MKITVDLPTELWSEELAHLWGGIGEPVGVATRLTAREVQRGIQAKQKKSRMWRLRESWTLRMHEEAPSLPVGSVFSKHVLARLREYGHKGITPGKSAARTGPNQGSRTQALAIPIFKNAKRAKPLHPVDFDPAQKGKAGGLFAARSKRGNLILFQKPRTKKGRPEPMFVLVRSVKVEGRHDVRDTLREQRQEFARNMRREIVAYFERAA